MDELKKMTTKLKELIFIKKGSGQDAVEDEKLLADLEKGEAEREAAAAQIREALQKNEQDAQKCGERLEKFKAKLIGIVKLYQDALLDAFREEREIEELRDARDRLNRQMGIAPERGFARRSIAIGSTRVQWVDDEIWPLGEEFRHRLILDNKEYFTAKRPGRKRVPIVHTNPLDRFIPERAEDFVGRGIPIPKSWEKPLADWQRERAKFGQ